MSNNSDATSNQSDNSAATQTPTKPGPSKTNRMPLWRVLLHNDDVNDITEVVQAVFMLTPLEKEEAVDRVLEAGYKGVSLLLTTHRERAELYVEQFASKSLTVTADPETE